MNKKKALLLCLLVLVVCLFGAVGCELAEPEHTHDYAEHPATAATCTADGNELYYTCKGCDKIFDKDKKEISSVPVLNKIDHDYVEHAATAATCTADGNELYYSCKNCDKIFDKEKKEISAIPVIAASHAYVEHAAVAATCTTDGNELYYTCGNCDKIFDKDKKEIAAVPVVSKGEHNYVEHARVEATCETEGNDLYYTCDGCHGLFDKDKQPIAEIPVIAAKNHAYHEVPAVAAGCETAGNDLYYTCDNGCGKLFDKDKNEISAIPVTSANGHTYVEHAAVAATCTADGNELYYTCANCDKIFDKDKKETTSVPTIGATGHDFAWVRSDDGKTAELKCANDGCVESKGTINLAVNEDSRAVVDLDATNATINLGLFGEGLTAKSVKYLQKTATVTTDGNNVTFAVADLFDYAVGKVAVQLTVAKQDKEIEVEMLLTVAKLVNNIDDLLALRPTLSNGLASVAGGKVEEIDGHRVVTSYYYLLTTDLDGTTRTGKTVYGEDITDEGDTSGNAKSGFVGIFDGGKHTISNFEMPVRGFFGHVGSGTIANVTFANIVLSGEQSTVLGKLMNATLHNVTIENIEITATLSDVTGVVAYHEIFGSTLSDVNIDLGGLNDKVNVLARQLVDGTGEWKANLFERVTVKADYNKNVRLTSDKALTDTINGLTVQFTPFSIDKPVGNDETYYYTGHELTYAVAASELYTVSGNKQTEIGTYTVTVSLKPYAGLTWADGTTDDVTFTFAIIELTDEIAQQLATAFAEKVEALGTPTFPKDKDALSALMSEYDVLHDVVKSKLTEIKTTLDGYVEQADAFVQLNVTFASDRIMSSLSGYDEYYLVIYNPNDTDVAFYYAGDADGWAGTGHCTLKSKTYTQMVYDKKFVAAGNAYMYGNRETINFNDTQSGWICKVYGKKLTAGEEVVALSVKGTVDNETYGKVLETSALAGYFEKFGTMTKETLESLAKFDNVYFYIYNPSDVDVAFFFQDNKDWNGLDRTVLKAKAWTKVSVSQALTLPEGATMVYVDVDKNTEGFVADGWMISDFYGTVK